MISKPLESPLQRNLAENGKSKKRNPEGERRERERERSESKQNSEGKGVERRIRTDRKGRQSEYSFFSLSRIWYQYLQKRKKKKKTPKQSNIRVKISELGVPSMFINRKSNLNQRAKSKGIKKKKPQVGGGQVAYRVLEQRLGVIFSWSEGRFLLLLLLLLSLCLLALTPIFALHSFSLSPHLLPFFTPLPPPLLFGKLSNHRLIIISIGY